MTSDSAVTEGRSFNLTSDERSDVFAKASEVFPNDKASQKEVAKFRGACILLHKIFGDEWYQVNIAPRVGARETFIRQPLSEELDRYLYVMRVIELAEALFSLRRVPSLLEHVDECTKNTMRAEGIQGAWFEFWVPYLIQASDHKIEEFIPSGSVDKTPDLFISYRDHRLAIEVKAKLEETPYSGRGLLRLMNKAFSQIPEHGPGVVFLMVPTQWLGDSRFQAKSEGVLERALTRNRNCNGLFVLWPLNEKLPTGEFLYSWRFRHFIATNPLCPIASVDELIAKRTMRFESMPATFLELAG